MQGYPSTEPERLAFGAFVSQMRELGVVSAFGVTLGPSPRPVDALRIRARIDPTLEPELRAEVVRARLAELYDEYRDKLAANGREYTDEQIRGFIPEELLRAAEQGT